ncbi:MULTISPECIES: RDD family protein [unclassified Streptosporangium]|uniref:RDD family protein n=1 Tax=unclassified Streptosporangium TaxID=2632669 RepID=UPI002E2D0C24|nr:MULTISPECIES: RDD family protein [unclassified Streptosporangium]
MGSAAPPPDDRGSDPWSDPAPPGPGCEGPGPGPGHAPDPGPDPRPGHGPSPGPGHEPAPGPGHGPGHWPGHRPGHGPGHGPVFGHAPAGEPPGGFPWPGGIRLGGRWRRLFAGILDLLVVGLISSPFTYRTVTTVTGAESGLSVQVPYAETLLVAVIGFLYYWLLTAFWNGQTLGKKIFRLRVADISGKKAGVGQVALRELVTWLMYSTCCLGWIDVAFILFHPRKQAVHDIAARTLVIDA